MLLSLLLLLACSPSSEDDTASTVAGWVEVEASPTVMPDYWYAESPVEGPAPVELWVTPDGARWGESESMILWMDQDDRPLVDLMAVVGQGEERAVFYIWVE